MRQSAVVPPILLESRNRCRYVYVDNNGLARDPMKEQQNRLSLFQILWSEEEKKIFKDKFMQYGKNFAAISVYLDKKVQRKATITKLQVAIKKNLIFFL